MNGVTKMREVRHHGFAGAHVQSMWKGALILGLKESAKGIEISIKNPQPHNIPSGFGSRELIVEVSYKKGSKVVEEKTISLSNHYTRKKNLPTIPHLATAQSKDASVPAKGEKLLYEPKVKGSEMVEVKLYYRLVNDEVRTLLDLKEPIWSERHLVSEAVLKF